ncbi:MAG: hypothetical protein LC768_06015 [Acidobacteria bacterium]|nr:hypothetical protein [Acidobacteriota bacterium]MCA1637879.1 hypothetical protein [Acidobacteriota bacterium]
MIKENKLLILIGVISACVIILVSLEQKQSITVKAQSGMPKLMLELTIPSNSYVLLEPIPVSFKLSNQTSTPISWL